MDYQDHVAQLFIAGILGLGSVGTAFAAFMSLNVHKIRVLFERLEGDIKADRQSVGIRLDQHDDLIQDHEIRIRYVERPHRS